MLLCYTWTYQSKQCWTYLSINQGMLVLARIAWGWLDQLVLVKSEDVIGVTRPVNPTHEHTCPNNNEHTCPFIKVCLSSPALLGVGLTSWSSSRAKMSSSASPEPLHWLLFPALPHRPLLYWLVSALLLLCSDLLGSWRGIAVPDTISWISSCVKSI